MRIFSDLNQSAKVQPFPQHTADPEGLSWYLVCNSGNVQCARQAHLKVLSHCLQECPDNTQ